MTAVGSLSFRSPKDSVLIPCVAGSANSNEALEISLIKPSAIGLKTIASCNPKFTYPIFGDDERIFGYQNLKINLKYHVTDMRPNLHISYSKKFKSVGDTEPTDIEGILKEFLPEGESHTLVS